MTEYASLPSGRFGAARVIPPMFPFSVKAGDVTIALNADGSWSGDGAAFIAAVAGVKGNGNIMLWLIVNAIRNTKA